MSIEGQCEREEEIILADESLTEKEKSQAIRELWIEAAELEQSGRA